MQNKINRVGIIWRNEHGVNKEMQIMKFNGNEVSDVEKFVYLGSYLQKGGSFEKYIKHGKN